MRRKLSGHINVVFDATVRLLIIYSAFAKYSEKREYNEKVHQLFTDFKKGYDSVRSEIFYKILIEFGIPRKLVRLTKMSLTETYSRFRVGKSVPDRFPIRSGLKKETLYHQCFLTFL